jgi:hypothetical protein
MTNPAAAHRALEWLSGEYFVVHRLDAVMVGTMVRSIEILGPRTPRHVSDWLFEDRARLYSTGDTVVSASGWYPSIIWRTR